jgi:predicted ATPase
VIDTHLSDGKNLDSILSDQAALQDEVIRRQYEIESNLPADRRHYLDRALPDGIAYLRKAGYGWHKYKELIPCFTYKAVFVAEMIHTPFLDPLLPSLEDRTMTEYFIKQAYVELSYSPAVIPLMSVKQRISFLETHLGDL